MEKITRVGELTVEGSVHDTAAMVQGKTTLLRDYGFSDGSDGDSQAADSVWPAVDPGTSISGVLGAALTLVLAAGVAVLIRTFRRRRSSAAD